MISRLLDGARALRRIARHWDRITTLADEIGSCPICQTRPFGPSVVCFEHAPKVGSTAAVIGDVDGEEVLDVMLEADDLIVAPHAQALGELLDAEDGEADR